ncbi:MAG: NUDIX domain-containing protein [Patescibacteria group bacterium]
MDLSQTIHRPVSDQGDVFWGNNASSGITSMTIQTVLLHPSIKGLVYWVLNQEETKSTRHALYNSPKPRGWGNPGGGVELIDSVNECGIPHSFEKTIASCARRELTDETGFTNFEFKRNSASGLAFTRYDDPYGHCVITLVAQLYDHVSLPIKEIEEIVCGSWFDFSISPIKLFQDTTDLPYWSHVRRTITIFHRLAQQTGDNDVVRAIHPLWNLVFPIITQDPRFPQQGYLIPPPHWYHIMRIYITRRVHALDLDCIYEYLRPQIEEKRRQENDRRPPQKKSNVPDPYLSYTYQPSLRPSDCYHVSEQERRITEYEQDYRRWAEKYISAT